MILLPADRVANGARTPVTLVHSGATVALWAFEHITITLVGGQTT